MRLDRLMLDRGLVRSRSSAQALIMAGKVFVDGKRIDKSGREIDNRALIEVKSDDHPYVSRGGVKLETAIKEFNIRCQGKVALDVGASTGGFTDCFLQHGAAKVYALDVGIGQLDWGLRNDHRVVNLERTNARFLKREMLPDSIDIVAIDCSFISLKLVLPRIVTILSECRHFICLVKPQFEVGKGEVGKGGVVRDIKMHEKVLREISDFACSLGLIVKGLIPSPLRGPKGNKEFFIYLVSSEGGGIDIEAAIQKAISDQQF